MTERHGWDQFVSGMAQAANVSPAYITESSRLMDDLGLDSLSLAEVVVFLLVDLEMASLIEGLDQRDWTSVTAGELYQEYVEGRPRYEHRQYTIRPRA